MRKDAELWRQILNAELHMYNLLDFKVAIPCVADLNSCISMQVVFAAEKAGDSAQWPGSVLVRVSCHEEKASTPQFVALSAFLVELGLANEHEEVYRSPQLALAIAAARLALHAFGTPPISCVAALETAERDALGDE
jgi:hypothetical protein